MGINDGRIVVITGAGRGIGREHALEFASQGAKIVVNDLGAEVDGTGSSAGPAGEVVDEIRGMGAEAVANGDDVSDYEGAGRLIQTAIDTFGGLDVLVNNAGIGMFALNGPDALRVFDTNAVGIIRVTEAALPLLKKSENPVVVNISSALGSFWANHEPSRPASQVSAIVYGASKAAVSMLTVQYARAVPEVKFNAVEPGYTATELGGVKNERGRPVEISARNIVRMATIGKDGPTGTFQEDDGELGW
jgi:NAD(P)-dependent dehydrogenase (short-subunit alcohol dehydrogenase family)